MTDDTPFTPSLARRWCPTCQPDVDPSVEIVEAAYCVVHPSPAIPAGLDDDAVPDEMRGAYLGVNGEAGGADNAALCRAIHRPA